MKFFYGQLVATLHSMPGRWPIALLLCIRASTRWLQMKGKVKSADILHRFNAQYGEETLSSHASVYYDLM
jgi:hypothetical protein